MDVSTGTQFCHHCAARECPSFLTSLTLTLEDVLFLISCGVDPQVDEILAYLDTPWGQSRIRYTSKDYERVGSSDDVQLLRRKDES